MARRPRTTLSAKQTLFIKNYIAGRTAKAAAILAGYSEKNASHAAGELLKHPLVVAELEKDRKEIIESGKYDRDIAVKEIDQDIIDAKRAGQHNAVASFRQLKMKAYGLLVEKHLVQQVPFTVEIVRPEIDVTPKNEDDETQGEE